MELPKPSSQRGGSKRKSQAADEFMLRDFGRSIIEVINRASQHLGSQR